MSDLIEFLRARLDDDAILAQAYLDGRRRAGTDRETWAYKLLLADFAAKRRILHSFTASEEPLSVRTAEKAVVRMVLRLLALPYADHPDYRPEWKP